MGARMPQVDHVVCVAKGVDPEEPQAHTRCTHCGERLVLGLPMRVDTWLSQNRTFMRDHARCPAPAAGARSS